MRSVVFIVAILALAGCDRKIGGRSDTGSDGPRTSPSASLSILSWSDYLVPEVLAEFEAAHRIEISVTEVDNTQQLIQSLSAEPNRFDVIIADDMSLRTLIGLQLVGELNRDRIPGIVNVAEEFKGLYFDPENRFSVPYLWGTTVIAYRAGEIPEGARSWGLLWDEKYRGKIGILDEPDEMFFVSLLEMGVFPEKADETQVGRARERLTENFVKLGGRMRDYQTALDQLQSGELSLAMTYSGDAALRAERDPAIEFFVPEEGAPLWLDSFAVSRDAPSPVLAHQFIEYMVSPKAAAESANSLSYASPNAAARPFIDESLLRHPGLYPPPRLLGKCRFVHYSDLSRSLVQDNVRRMIGTIRSKGIDPGGETAPFVHTEAPDRRE